MRGGGSMGLKGGLVDCHYCTGHGFLDKGEIALGFTSCGTGRAQLRVRVRVR